MAGCSFWGKIQDFDIFSFLSLIISSPPPFTHTLPIPHTSQPQKPTIISWMIIAFNKNVLFRFSLLMIPPPTPHKQTHTQNTIYKICFGINKKRGLPIEWPQKKDGNGELWVSAWVSEWVSEWVNECMSVSMCVCVWGVDGWMVGRVCGQGRVG